MCTKWGSDLHLPVWHYQRIQSAVLYNFVHREYKYDFHGLKILFSFLKLLIKWKKTWRIPTIYTELALFCGIPHPGLGLTDRFGSRLVLVNRECCSKYWLWTKPLTPPFLGVCIDYWQKQSLCYVLRIPCQSFLGQHGTKLPCVSLSPDPLPDKIKHGLLDLLLKKKKPARTNDGKFLLMFLDAEWLRVYYTAFCWLEMRRPFQILLGLIPWAYAQEYCARIYHSGSLLIVSCCPESSALPGLLTSFSNR